MHAVSYDDAAHRYYVGTSTYISATQLIKHFKTPFDAGEWAEWMVYRYGNTKEYWLDKWSKENQQSLVRGNKLHNKQEDRLHKKGYDLLPYPVPVRSRPKTNQHYYDMEDGVYTELMLWRHDCGIAGRADKIILRTESCKVFMIGRKRQFPAQSVQNRYLDIDDYKTNKKIRTESYQNPVTKEYTMMLGPVSHLMDCELSHYTLQFSIYQYMGEYFGFQPGKRRIIHFPHPVPGIAASGPQIKELPYLRDEVIAMIKHYNGSKDKH